MSDKYQYRPCIEYTDEEGMRVVEEASDSDTPHFWGVYERNGDCLSTCIADFYDEVRAQEYVKWLLER